MLGLNLATAVKHLQDVHKYKQILVECGPSTTKDLYMRPLDMEVDAPDCDMPMDSLMLTVYNGLVPAECIGPEFPSLDQIGLRYNMLMHTVPIETAEGQWSITSWRIKSKAELLRLKGSTGATSYQDQVREEVQQKKLATLAELEP